MTAMKEKHRFAAVLMCVILTAVILLSSFYIVEEAHHDCTGQNCPICHEIQLCIQMLNTACGAVVIAAVTLLTAFKTSLMRACMGLNDRRATLVSLKVKLSD